MLKVKCLGCKEEKDTSEFYKNNKKKLGVQDYCKICKALIDKNGYTSQKDKINEFKTNKGGKCLKCNENRLHILDFHHINPKEKEYLISELVYKTKIDWVKLNAELDKCILLCSNCHRDFHHQERDNNITIDQYLT